MRIINSKINSNYNTHQTYHDPSFEALKKSNFNGIDFAIVEKFKAPIEKFDVHTDFQNWAENLVEKIRNTEFVGRQTETVTQRKEILKNWFNYVIERNEIPNKSIQLLILSAITNSLGQKDDNLPPTFNEKVLKDCINELNKELEKDKKLQFDFDKIYKNKLRTYYTGEKEANINKWIIITSETNDPNNFKSNVEKLKALSYRNWCTKSFNADFYLSQGNMHIYLEKGKPKIGIRFLGSIIQEIQGELNNSEIPLQYLDFIKKYINKNNFNLSRNSKKQIIEAEKLQNRINKAKHDIYKILNKSYFDKFLEIIGIKTFDENKQDTEKIFNYIGIQTQKDKNGKLILSEYRQPDIDITYKDIGLDENDLFKNVVAINGYANFENSDLKSLYNLKKIKGEAYFVNSQIRNLGELESIYGNAIFCFSKIKSLNKLKEIKGNGIFSNSKVIDLGDLYSIGGCADFVNSQITKTKNLYYIGKDAKLRCSNVTNLENLHTVAGNLDLENSSILDLGNLKEVGKCIIYNDTCNLKESDFKNIKVGERILKK